jgi:tight adherence protein C
MSDVPVVVMLIAGVGVFAAGAWGRRGLLEIREALLLAEFDRLISPPNWPATRALVGVLAAMPALAAAALVSEAPLGRLALLGALTLVIVGFWAAPRLLLAARRRVERQILDELSLHLDLLALAMESGSSWSKALELCRERAPAGPLQRAWERVILEIHAGAEPLDALRNLEQRIRLRPLATLVSALRAADKLQMPAGPVLRERARQAAACRFARAEQAARVAPLKLWAAMLLCLAPCTAVVLAFPLAQGLAWLLR